MKNAVSKTSAQSLNDLIACTICGYKQGGTTLFTSLLVADKSFTGRFETGLLQAKSPQAILKTRDNVQKNLMRSWELSQELLEKISQKETFYEAYRTLLDSKEEFKDKKIIDKYPDYIRHVDDIALATSTPIIFVARDPRALYWSRLKRLNGSAPAIYEEENVENVTHGILTPERFSVEYLKLFRLAKEYEKKYQGQFHIFKLENMLTNPQVERTRLFALLDRDVPKELFGNIGVSDQKVRSGFDMSVITDFENNLSNKDELALLSLCADAKEFFSAGSESNALPSEKHQLVQK